MREVKSQSQPAAEQSGLIITSLFVFIFMNRNRYDCVNPQTFYCCINSGMAVRIPFGINVKIILRILLKEKFPDTLLMFVTPPNARELKSRLVGRGTETMEVIESRMNRACEEAEGMSAYDYLVVNDELDDCVEEMHSIIQGEHHRSSRNVNFMNDIKEELEELKGEN